MGTGTAGNAYKYNGKEHHTDFGLGWYNYGARYYAPDAPRWTTLDPLAEKYLAESPYNYVSQNPMNFTDPTGMSKDGVGINSSGNIIYDDNKDDGKLYYLYDKKDKINSLEGQNYAEISSGWGQWTEHKDTRLFMDAVFRYVGYGNNLSDYGDIVYSKSQTALAAIDPRGDKNKLVSSASSTAVEFNYLSKPNLELTEYKGLSNIHILRSVLEHEGLHMKQIATGQFEKRSQKSWWASVYHYMYTVRGPAESAAYNAQINNDSKHWQNVLLRANQHYMQGALFMEFVKKVKDGRDTERAIWENAANRLGLPIPPK